MSHLSDVPIQVYVEKLIEAERRTLDAHMAHRDRYDDATRMADIRHREMVYRLTAQATEMTRLWTAERLHSHNEWRKKSEVEASTFARKEDIEHVLQTFGAGQERVLSQMSLMKERIDKNEGARSGMTAMGTIIVSVITAVGAGATILGTLMATGVLGHRAVIGG